MPSSRLALQAEDFRVHRLRDDLLSALDETDRLCAQMEHLSATNVSLSARLQTTDARSDGLMKLLVSVRALIDSRNATDALAGLRDILINVIGAAEFVVYAIDPETMSLVPMTGLGKTFSGAEPSRVDHSWLGDIVQNGEVVIAFAGRRGSRRGKEHNAAAIVPLKVLDRVIGAIVIARVLPHRDLLDSCDREVLALIGAYAATAIIAADRRAEWSRLPVPQ